MTGSWVDCRRGDFVFVFRKLQLSEHLDWLARHNRLFRAPVFFRSFQQWSGIASIELHSIRLCHCYTQLLAYWFCRHLGHHELSAPQQIPHIRLGFFHVCSANFLPAADSSKLFHSQSRATSNKARQSIMIDLWLRAGMFIS